MTVKRWVHTAYRLGARFSKTAMLAGKLLVLVILGASALILGGRVVKIVVFLHQNKSHSLPPKPFVKNTKERADRLAKSKPVQPRRTPVPADELNLRQTLFVPHETDERTAANSHLGEALRLIPFEVDGGKRGNAYPPPVLNSEYRQEGRGSDFVKIGKKKTGMQSAGWGMKRRKISFWSEGVSLPSTSWFGLEKERSLLRGMKGFIMFFIDGVASLIRTEAAPGVEQGNVPFDTHLSKRNQVGQEALFHLEKASELGNSYAQNMIANALASGILPVDNSIQLSTNSSLNVAADFSEGGEQLASAIVLWHMSAMDGVIESAMALGYRHRYSAMGGQERPDELVSGAGNSSETTHSASPTAHYGVMGTCESALAYYEAAANAIMDELESSELRGQVDPAVDLHELPEIYAHGGTSSTLAFHNKPDETEESLLFYRTEKSPSSELDLNTAYTLANFYHYGIRGVKQDMKLALKYYEIAAGHGSWHAACQAGNFYFWGIGVEEHERDLGKAHEYFEKGTPGGYEGCAARFQKVKRKKKQTVQMWDEDEEGENKSIWQCKHQCVNGLGLLALFGVPNVVRVDAERAKTLFMLARDMGNVDAAFNLAMMRLGWMGEELGGGNGATKRLSLSVKFQRNLTSKQDYALAISDFVNAASRGHMQAKHRLAAMFANGIHFYGENTESTNVTVLDKNCAKALSYYRDIAEVGPTVARRTRAAYKQYIDGDYESSLRNYLAAAETGSEIGQINAAFLLERGYCLGMNKGQCSSASLRLWRAAARQGNEEAWLRIGDFYYYGRTPNTATGGKSGGFGESTRPYSLGPFLWTYYVVYPEKLLARIKSNIVGSARWIATAAKKIGAQKVVIVDRTKSQTTTHRPVVSLGKIDAQDEPEHEGKDRNGTFQQNLAIAAQYYRIAAEKHNSARANFNLGYMHEWGLGLSQDFQLSKVHYTMAERTSFSAKLAIKVALFSLDIHKKIVNFRPAWRERLQRFAKWR